MTLAQVSAKIDLRLNKGASADYDNLWPYHKEEAFNKAVGEWVRRQKHGKNQTQEGDEESSIRVDDLQVLLKVESLSSKDKGLFNQTEKLPSDYLYFKRITPMANKNNCSGVRLRSDLREEANVDQWIDFPSFDFEETFHTIINNRAHVYHNNDFEIEKIELTYYRKPKTYSFKKLSTVVEFNDTICDMIVDEACKIIASDIESFNQQQLAEKRVEDNN